MCLMLEMLTEYIFSYRVVINADASYIKMVSEQFDRCHGTLLQYVEFLCSAVTPATAYAQLIPSLDDLVHLYHLDPEVSLSVFDMPSNSVFLIYNSFPSLYFIISTYHYNVLYRNYYLCHDLRF